MFQNVVVIVCVAMAHVTIRVVVVKDVSTISAWMVVTVKIVWCVKMTNV